MKDSNFKKKIRWNSQTRDYETLSLNDSNQTKEEYEKFSKDFSDEHDSSEDDEVWALVEGAEELFDHASFETIIDYYDEALKKKPDNPDLLLSKGDFLFIADKPEEAIKLMDKILEIDSNYAKALFFKSGILKCIGKTEEAKECRDRAEKMKNKDSK